MLHVPSSLENVSVMNFRCQILWNICILSVISNIQHGQVHCIYISIRNYDPLLEALPFPRVFKCVPFSFSLFFWSYEWKWGNNLIMNGRLNKMLCFFNTRYREFPASTPIPHVRPSAAARARERSKSVLLKKQTKVF